jgi:hypothetical protein
VWGLDQGGGQGFEAVRNVDQSQGKNKDVVYNFYVPEQRVSSGVER